jgi:hypothetical protein
MNRHSSHAVPAAGARKHLATVVRSPARDCCGRCIALAANASGPGPMPAPAPPHRTQRVRGGHLERSNRGGTPRGCVGPQRLPSCRVAGSGDVQDRTHAPEPPGRPLTGAASTPNPNPNPNPNPGRPLAGAASTHPLPWHGPPAVVAGGGIGGLAAALALHKVQAARRRS